MAIKKVYGDIEVRGGTVVLLGVLAAWGLAVAVAAAAGFYRALYPPLIGPLALLGVVAPTVVYFRSKGFRRYIENIGLRGLTVFHILRIGAALVFFWYGAHDLLPGALVRHAGWGDLLVGLFAVAITLLPESRNRYLAFHLAGFTDIAVAMGTALAFILAGDPRMGAVGALPMALIPLYAVGIVGSSHLMAFDLLRRGAGLKADTKPRLA